MWRVENLCNGCEPCTNCGRAHTTENILMCDRCNEYLDPNTTYGSRFCYHFEDTNEDLCPACLAEEIATYFADNTILSRHFIHECYPYDEITPADLTPDFLSDTTELTKALNFLEIEYTSYN